MTAVQDIKPKIARIDRPDHFTSILAATGRDEAHIRAGTAIEHDGRRHTFEIDAPIVLADLVPGRDYGIRLDADGTPHCKDISRADVVDASYIAGFHFSAGGCATARAGGDIVPAINPHSLWDAGFRPTCPDPRGMALIKVGHARFWADIYLLGVDHREQGTSRCDAKIADGRSVEILDYPTAVSIYASHGKRLLSYDEFRAAAIGVTERSSADRHPKKTGIDAARTSLFGLMQATGNLWVWGTDGDPDDPRPSIFGGSWFSGVHAGSRYANLDYWPVHSSEHISARGASDHLTLV